MSGPLLARIAAAHRNVAPPPASVSFIAASATTFSTGTSQSQNIPASAQTGDLLIACIMHRDTLTPPAGWTLVRTAGPVASPAQYTSVYKRIAQAGDAGASTTWTQATSQRIAVHIQAFRKTGGCNVLSDNAQTVNGTGTDNFVFNTPAATASGQMFVAAGSIALQATAGTNTLSVSSGWTETTPSSSSDTANQIRLIAAYRATTAAGSVSGTFTAAAGSSTNSWACDSILIG